MTRSLDAVRMPRLWWRQRPPRETRVCYPTKTEALTVFLDVNRALVDNYGGASYEVSPAEFDAINHKYGTDARMIAEAVWAALPAQKRGPYCLDAIDIDALNDTSPAREFDLGFQLPDWVHEDDYETGQEAYYRSLEGSRRAKPMPWRQILFISTLAGLGVLILRRSAFGVIFGKPAAGLVSSGWGDARVRDGERGAHHGIDIRCPVGTPVFAAAPGVVTRADDSDDSLAGKHINLQHDTRAATRYLHLSELLVAEGDEVLRGERIATSGDTGIKNSAPHLHFELHLTPAGVLTYLNKFGAPDPAIPPSGLLSGFTPVPAEALVPVDGYQADVLESAEARNVSVRPR